MGSVGIHVEEPSDAQLTDMRVFEQDRVWASLKHHAQEAEELRMEGGEGRVHARISNDWFGG